MGQGTFTLFNEFGLEIGNKAFQFPTGGDTFKCCIINATKVPAATDANPVKTDYTEVSGGTYVAQTLANQDYTRSGVRSTFVCDPITFAQDAASGPVDCYYALFYENSSGKCIGWVDLTADGGVTPLSLKAAAIGLNPGAGSNEVFYVDRVAA